MRDNTTLTNEIKKLKVKEIVLFAINNIPEADTTTLKQFLELVNAGGTFGAISHEQILKKMQKVLKYIPGASVHSLLILTDLLEISLPNQLLLSDSGSKWLEPGQTNNGSTAFFIEAPKVMTPESNGSYSR